MGQEGKQMNYLIIPVEENGGHVSFGQPLEGWAYQAARVDRPIRGEENWPRGAGFDDRFHYHTKQDARNMGASRNFIAAWSRHGSGKADFQI